LNLRQNKIRDFQIASSPLCLLEDVAVVTQLYARCTYNLSVSTTCFGHCCCGHLQVGYNFCQRNNV